MILFGQKASNAWHYLHDPSVREVFFGGGARCFLAGTPVLTDRGYVPIEQVGTADRVRSFDLQSNTTVWGKVVATQANPAGHDRHNCIILCLASGEQIRCTEEHEFFVGGNWMQARTIAERAMEGRIGHSGLLRVEHGTLGLQELEKPWERCFHEASGNTGVHAYDAEVRGQVQDHQSASNRCAGMGAQPGQLGDSGSHKLRPGGQSGRESCMGHAGGQFKAVSGSGSLCIREGVEEPVQQAQREYGEGNPIEVLRGHDKEAAGGRVWGGGVNDKGRYPSALEARCLSIVDIVDARLFQYDAFTHDLTIEGHHNYAVGFGKYIAHNSGKSMLLCGHEISEAATWPGTRGLICREDFTALQDSTMKTFFEEVLPMFGYEAGRHFTYNGQEHNITWANGSETMFRHMKFQPKDPNYSRIGSTAFTRISIDEGDELEERAFELLRARTGYKEPPHGGKIITTGNPGEYWTKYRYVYSKKGERVIPAPDMRVVLATVADNPDPVAKARYTELMKGMRDPYDRERLLNGNWLMQPRTGMEFFPEFKSTEHLKRNAYDPAIPLHITFDFNAAPYITLLIAQIKPLPLGKWHLGFIKEYCLEHPLSTTKAVCTALAHDLRSGIYAGHRAGLFYYGDASGKSKSTLSNEDFRHNYDIVENILGPWLNNGSDRVLRRNPPHVKARDFMNDIFAHKMPIEVSFDEEMHTTVRDLVNLKQGADGGILKVMVKDRKTGISYEQWGHCAQAVYYLVIAAFPDIYAEHETIAA